MAFSGGKRSVCLAKAVLLATLGIGLVRPSFAAEPSFADQLDSLAARCDELRLPAAAKLARDWIVPRHLGRQYLFLPTAAEPAPADAAVPFMPEFRKKFGELRADQAETLYVAARAASDAGESARAYQLLHEVLRENPDHPAARAILGYQQNARGQWALAGAANLAARQARVDHPQLGWRARTYWRLETAHFEIVTNHSAKEALELGQQLEDLHALWRQIFFRYWSSSEALAARFAGQNEPLSRPRPKMRVVLERSRAEYLAQLAASVPQIERTVGIYLHAQRTAFFYAGDTSVYPTWYHEATHQLFQEAIPGTIDQPGEDRNFWLIEGAALYMESLARHDGYWTAGGCEADRLQFARYRALAGDFSLPLAELAAQSREDIQTSPEIGKLYSQAAAVSHFLIDGAKGRHREALVDLLSAVYRGDDSLDSLPQLTASSFGQLETEYRDFLNVTDDDLASIPSPQRLRNLSLGRTAVTDQGLAHLAGCKQLEWLDLSATGVTDAGLQSLAGMNELRQLFLEGTKITDAGLAIVGGLKQLEELDLSNLAGVSDRGLAALAPLKQLKKLHLSGTPITDAGLVHLRGLKRLEALETAQSNVTPAGLQQLRSALPKWQGP
ncbi:MAG: hypothetical protein WD872_11335 [Pirellulaceae bacterium]